MLLSQRAWPREPFSSPERRYLDTSSPERRCLLIHHQANRLRQGLVGHFMVWVLAVSLCSKLSAACSDDQTDRSWIGEALGPGLYVRRPTGLWPYNMWLRELLADCDSMQSTASRLPLAIARIGLAQGQTRLPPCGSRSKQLQWSRQPTSGSVPGSVWHHGVWFPMALGRCPSGRDR